MSEHHEHSTEDQIIDWDEAVANLSGDVGMLREVVNVFLERCQEQLQELEESLADCDYSMTRARARDIADEAENFCGHRISRTARELEALMLEGSQVGASELLERLYREWQRLEDWAGATDWQLEASQVEAI